MKQKKRLAGEGPGERGQWSCLRGEHIYAAGEDVGAWRIVSGSVRLDRPGGAGEAVFAGLAISGDVIGAETLAFGATNFSATALAPSVLVPWPEGLGGAVDVVEVSLSRPLLQALALAERRAADVIALRCGQAMDRVRRLVVLLATGEAGERARREVRVVLPSLRDMAEITALKIETVSRAITQLRRDGLLEAETQRRPGIPRRGSYALHAA